MVERRTPQPRGHVLTILANRRIAVDFTPVWTARDRLVAVAISVDRGCRTVLDVTATQAQTSAAILASDDRAPEVEFGSPAAVPDGVELRIDHGHQTAGHHADALTRVCGVTQTLAPLARPTGKAGAEPTTRTRKEEYIWLADWPDATTLTDALWAGAEAFNHRRPHQALDWQPPAERR